MMNAVILEDARWITRPPSLSYTTPWDTIAADAHAADREAHMATETLRVRSLVAAAEGRSAVAGSALDQAWQAAEGAGTSSWAIRIATDAVAQRRTGASWSNRSQSLLRATDEDPALPDPSTAHAALAGSR